jgi:DNA-binding transcriptional LysR family regulator
MQPKVTLDQWRAFVAVVEAGGYARAAEHLNISQSSVSYAVSRLQELLDIQVLKVSGRKTQLTPAGKSLYPKARQLLQDAYTLENTACALKQGWEAELVVVTDVLCPTHLLLKALKRFQPQSHGTGILLREEVLSGTDEAIVDGRTHLGLSPHIPPGCTGELLLHIEFVPVSHPEHPLQNLTHGLSFNDLNKATQIFIRDTGAGKKFDDSMATSAQRWTVSSREAALEMVREGFGFCWVPRPWIEHDLAAGRLQRLALKDTRHVPLYLVFPRHASPGPATLLLVSCLKAVMEEMSDCGA